MFSILIRHTAELSSILALSCTTVSQDLRSITSTKGQTTTITEFLELRVSVLQPVVKLVTHNLENIQGELYLQPLSSVLKYFLFKQEVEDEQSGAQRAHRLLGFISSVSKRKTPSFIVKIFAA